MTDSLRSKLPFLFLIAISLWWGFYYQSHSSLNGYGKANFEWLFLLDALVVLPLLCFLCIKDKKAASLKAVVLASIAIFIGSYIVPEQNKVIWPYFENGRYALLVVILLFEVAAIITVYLAIKSALGKQQDPDIAIEKPIKQYLGNGALATLFCFETRMWSFLLFAKRIRPEHFSGGQHFSYHQKDGGQTNLLGFIMLIAFELPIMHLLLHFIWSPLAANIVTLLTMFSLVFFIAEYRAVAKRPVSLVGNAVHIRYGLYPALVVPLSNIVTISRNTMYIERAKGVKRYTYAGYPNVALELLEPIGTITRVYIGLDKPGQFISAIEAGIKLQLTGAE